MRSRMGIGLCHAAILLLLAAIARADTGAYCGLEIPFLSTSGVGTPQSIDIGGDGVSDLLIHGGSVLYGLERLDSQTQLLVRQPDGRWVHREQWGFDYNYVGPRVFDVDGDGLDDVIGMDGGHLLYLRQNAGGLLERAGDITVTPPRADMEALPLGNGLALAIGLVDLEGDYSTFTAQLVRWQGAANGLQRLWSDSLGDFISNDLVRPFVAVDGADSPYLVGRVGDNNGTMRLWAIPITQTGPGATVESRPISFDNYDLSAIRSGGRSDLILWSKTAADSLYKVVPGVDSVSLLPCRIEGMPRFFHGSRNRYPTVSLRDGSTIAAVPRMDSLGSCIAFVRFNGADPPRCVGRTRWADSTPLAVLATLGGFEILTVTSDTVELRSSERPITSAADVPFRIRVALAAADLDGDGMQDLVFAGAPPDSGDPWEQIWTSRGIDHPPWFGPPTLVGDWTDPNVNLSSATNVTACDLDGDGRRDLLFTSGWRDSIQINPFFQDAEGFSAGASTSEPNPNWYAYNTRVPVADFDGDGHAEAVYQTAAHGGEIRTLRWNADRTIDPAVGPVGEVTGVPALAADLDGDGRSELVMLNPSGTVLSEWRIYPSAHASRKLASLEVSYLRDVGSCDVNGDRRDELTVDESSAGISIWSLGVDSAAVELRTGIQLLESYRHTVRAIDLDADGGIELVYTDDDGYSRTVEILERPLDSDSQSRIWSISDPDVDPADGASKCWIDVDRDGDLDLVVVCRDGIQVRLSPSVHPGAGGASSGMLRVLSANPGGASARVAVRLPGGGPVSLGLFDVTGRALWRTAAQAPAGDWLEVLVRPHPADGAIAAGVYFLKVEGGGRVATRRILLGF